MKKFDIIKPQDLKRITKGKIGEWIAKDYYRNKGYVVWLLEPYYYGGFYSGTGKKYINADLVLTPFEKVVLESLRAFDLLIIPEDDVKLIKKTTNIRHYHLLRTLFVNVAWKNGLEYLRKYVDLDLKEKIELIKPQIEELVKKEKISERWLIEQNIKSILINMEERHTMLKNLKRVLVDVKTKWSKYNYPKSAKCKDSELTKFFKNLGFECEVLEINIICPEIKLTTSKI